MIKTKLILISLVISSCCITKAQKTIQRDSLLSDFQFFIEALENTHPDPYTAFGGRVFFHQQAFEIENKLKNNDYTKEEFTSILSSFLSTLKDGHTNIRNTEKNKNATNLTLPLTLGNSGDELYITSLPEIHKELLGSRLVSINDVPAQQLFDKTGELNPTENHYGKTLRFRKSFAKFDYMKRLLPNTTPDIKLQIRKPNGKLEVLPLKYLTPKEYQNTKLTEVESWDQLNNKYMYYQFLDKKKETMLFHLGSVMSKEAFIIMKEMNFSNMGMMLNFFYSDLLNRKRPKETDKAIEELPSIVELFHNMLVEMKKNHSENLVIDLRGNTGGFTSITLPTLYQLYGDDFLRTDFNTKYIRKISPLYMNKLGTTLEAYNKKHSSNYEFGDYIFQNKSEKEKPSIEEERANFIAKRSNLSPRVKDFDGEPIYRPKEIIVITDDRTYSAAFHYAFYLWKMGATIVGVPCCQAPNTFMEITSFTLPKTKISGSISNSYQLYLPPTDRRAKTFYPNHTMNWEDFQKYNFNKQAELMYTLDLLKEKSKQSLTKTK
ncbi:MAG: S41 family peptidase [Marinifilaceae bacterium]|jgi:hypothetical protein